MNIFELSNEYRSIMDEIEASGGEVTEEIAEALKINEQDVEKKIKAYYSVIKENESYVQLLKEEIERLEGRIKAKNSINTRLKQTIVDAIELFGSVPPKKKQKALIYDTISVSIKESENVSIGDDFDTKTTIEAYESYYKRVVTLELTQKQYDKLKIDEFDTLSTSRTVVPLKKEIKDFYKLREETKNFEIDPIPQTTIVKSYTPMFK